MRTNRGRKEQTNADVEEDKEAGLTDFHNVSAEMAADRSKEKEQKCEKVVNESVRGVLE